MNMHQLMDDKLHEECGTKLSVLKSVVDGKRIVMVDDSIVRGTTMASHIRL